MPFRSCLAFCCVIFALLGTLAAAPAHAEEPDLIFRKSTVWKFSNMSYLPHRSAGGAISVTRSRTSVLLDNGVSTISRGSRRAVQA